MPTFKRTLIKSSSFLGLACGWSVLTIICLFNYHFNEPVGTTSVFINGRTYYGNPPALTLIERDPLASAIVIAVLILGLLISLSDLALQIFSRSERRSKPALVTGIIMVVFSLFGLVWGLLSLGVVGLLIFLSAFSNQY